jgi:V/A-type H+-transporting ATPase subunit C
MKSKLLPKEDYPRLMNMEVSEITRFIEDSEYKTAVDELAQKYDGINLTEHALNQNLALTYRKLLNISAGEAHSMISSYFMRWDIWNIKAILRGKQYGASDEEILESVVSAGQLGYHDLITLVQKDTPGIIGVLEQNCPKSKSHRLFSEMIRTEIDIINLKTLFRSAKAEVSREQIVSMLVPGGSKLNMIALKKLAGLPFGEFVTSLKDYPYWEPISGIVSEDMKSLISVEIGLDKYGLEYATQTSHYYPLSIVPIMDYILCKKNEVNNIRMIVRGKEVGLPDDVIRSKLVL